MADEAKKQNRELRKLAEVMDKNQQFALNLMSLGLAVEALDTLLTEKGILRDNELMDKIEKLANGKAHPPEPAPSLIVPNCS